jgi:hypothetical protein
MNIRDIKEQNKSDEQKNAFLFYLIIFVSAVILKKLDILISRLAACDSL